MANEKLNEIDTKNIKEKNSFDIIEKLNDFVTYLKMDEDCQTLLKPSKIELKNEIKFKHRAEQIAKHHQQHNQIKIKEKIINELQQNISAISSDLNGDIFKENLASNDIAKICDKLMTLKLMNITTSGNVKFLKDFIKSNKNNLKDISKMKNEIKTVLKKLSSNEKPLNKSEIKATHLANTHRNNRSTMYFPNISRINDQETMNPVFPRTYAEQALQLGNLANENSSVLENERNTTENFINQSNINMSYEHHEDLTSHELIMTNVSSIGGDVIEFSSLNSTVNLNKDNVDRKSGDVHLILYPINEEINT